MEHVLERGMSYSEKLFSEKLRRDAHAYLRINIEIIYYDFGWGKFGKESDHTFAFVRMLICVAAHLNAGLSCRAERLLASQAFCSIKLP